MNAQPACSRRCVVVDTLLQDPRYVVTYYNNGVTGESTYDKPAAYADWEKRHAEWAASVIK